MVQKLMRHENVATTAKYAHALMRMCWRRWKLRLPSGSRFHCKRHCNKPMKTISQLKALTKKQRAKRFPNQTRYQTALCPAGRRRSIHSST
jgi:hypothetical protein